MAQIDTFKFDISSIEDIRKVKHYNAKVGENWPIVYVLNNDKEAYVGETVNAARRTEQHLSNPKKQSLTEIRIISDKDFNKSVILDLEAFLIKHMSADGKYSLINGNNGIQDHEYYERSRYEEEFKDIWKTLRKHGVVNKSIAEIENSELFKYSPYKSLGPDQLEVEARILNALNEFKDDPNGVRITVRGGAGTGKTILAVYLMKLIADINNGILESDPDEYFDENIETAFASECLSRIKRIGVVFPQKSLQTSMKEVFKCIRSLDKNMVLGTADVVRNYLKTGEKYDLLIVDEAHRLKCRNKGHLSDYRTFDSCSRDLGLDPEKSTELDWIIKCSRNQILFRDELQTIRPCDIDSQDYKDICESRYHAPNVVLGLSTQWRCKGGNDYINYVKNILSGRQESFETIENYEFIMFSDVSEMAKEIKRLNEEMTLCRMAAGYAWKWNSKKDRKAFDIIIGDARFRWNSTFDNWIGKNAVDEVGCIHTVQGYDLNYLGVIIGSDIKYDPEKKTIYADKDCYFDQQGKSGVANDPEALKEYLLNIYLTLLTRGIKGTYIYVCDDELRRYMSQYVEVR